MSKTIIDLIIENNFNPSNKDIKLLSEYIQEKKFDNLKNESEKMNIKLKSWNDYPGDYEFHSPPDCLYNTSGDCISAEFIECFGGKEFIAYKKSDKYFIIDNGYIEYFSDWNIQEIF
jgi:hypothetical protein